MRSTAKKPSIAAKSNKKAAKKTAKKTSPMAKSHPRAMLKGMPGRAKRLMGSNPVRVLLGAAATALVVAKLKQRFA